MWLGSLWDKKLAGLIYKNALKSILFNSDKRLLDFFSADKSFDIASRKIEIRLYLAEHQSKAVAGAIILLYGDTGYYLHGASDYDQRSLMAPYALHWFIIKYLKTSRQSLAASRYDLWGIDARRWPGVTRFKLGWGGRTVEYPGSFDLPISKFWYLAYRVARKVL